MTNPLQTIHIKFSGIDESSGAIFLQFATDETLPAIDQQVMHGFFPSEHGVEHSDEMNIEKLLPEMARFGQQLLTQQAEVQQNKFTQAQVQQVQSLIGAVRSVPIEAAPSPEGIPVEGGGQYNIDSVQNVNGNVDQMRNIVLEILAEEGLIKGAVK